MVEPPLKPKGKPHHKVREDRKDEKEVTVAKDYAKSKTIAKSTLATASECKLKVSDL